MESKNKYFWIDIMGYSKSGKFGILKDIETLVTSMFSHYTITKIPIKEALHQYATNVSLQSIEELYRLLNDICLSKKNRKI